MPTPFRTLAAVLASMLFALPAGAATDQEWAAFRADVAAKCVVAADGLFETATATVDPFGSEHFGLALIEGKACGADVSIRAICVYDKVAKTAEIGGELPTADAAMVVAQAASRAPSGLLWIDVLDPCAGPCQAATAGLAPEDAVALAALPDRVAATVAYAGETPGIRFDEDAATVFAKVRAADPSAPLAITPGEHACTVYWFGFLDNGGERVGRHRCAVERNGDRLTLTKLSGDRLAADLRALGAGARALVGRTFLADQPERSYDAAQPANRSNANFGNVVGLAFADGAGMLVVSADMRGFTEPDETFFQVLVVE